MSCALMPTPKKRRRRTRNAHLVSLREAGYSLDLLASISDLSVKQIDRIVGHIIPAPTPPDSAPTEEDHLLTPEELREIRGDFARSPLRKLPGGSAALEWLDGLQTDRRRNGQTMTRRADANADDASTN
jgi:hypothetical protein